MKPNKTKENVKSLLNKCFGSQKDERWNAIAMLIIFGMFIAILVVITRTNNISQQKIQKEPVVSSHPVESASPLPTNDTSNLDQEIRGDYEINYSYLYTFNLDGTQEVITGKRLDNKEIFTIIDANGSTEYAKLSDNYLKLENGKYQLINTPSVNLKYANLDPLLEVLEELTPSVNGNQYSYSVPTSVLVKAYEPQSTLTVSSESYNPVVITRNSNTIERLDIDYSNLYTFLNGLTSIYTIQMEFTNVGTTEDFNIQIK